MINIPEVALPIVDKLESITFTLAWLFLIVSVLVFGYNLHLAVKESRKSHS